MKIYVNGRILPEAGAKIPVLDRGFLYGEGLFETMKASNGKIFRLGEHLRRLASGAKILGLPAVKETEVEKNALRVLRLNGLLRGEARIKLVVTRTTVAIFAEPVDVKKIELLKEKGMRAVFSPGRGSFVGGKTGRGLKTLNYLANVLAREGAEKKGAHEAIFLGPGGEVLEGAATNIFIVEKGVIKTPALECGILPGIMRGAVLEMASSEGIPLKECRISRNDLFSSDEAFLTNSIIGIAPLVRVEGTKIGGGRPGKTTRLLQERCCCLFFNNYVYFRYGQQRGALRGRTLKEV